MPKEKEKKCSTCGGKVVARPGLGQNEYYCTKCRRRVWKPEWAKKDFVEIGNPEKRKRKSKAWFSQR